MSSSKQKGGRAHLTSQNTKNKDPNSKGCRSLQFDAHKPLKGKSFYLDVRKQGTRLKKDLEELGGVVETFLSKDISYVVSDRPEVKLDTAKALESGIGSGASPAVSTPSPFQQSKDSTHGAADSPSAANAREGMVTRGKAIVRKATISQTYGTSNVLANARNWKVNIRYVDSVIKYINKEKQKMKETGIHQSQARTQLSRANNSTSKERKLSRQSLKSEDASQQYRPATKEMTLWPRVSFNGPSGTCPFDPVTVHSRDTRENQPLDMRHAKEQDAQVNAEERLDLQEDDENEEVNRSKTGQKISHRSGAVKYVQTPSRQKNVGVKDNRRGYCECCLTKYTDLEKHLGSEQHRNFVYENNHYTNLDAMIDEGPNIDQFLEDVMHHHQWQSLQGIRDMEVADEVNLISSPKKTKAEDVFPKKQQTKDKPLPDGQIAKNVISNSTRRSSRCTPFTQVTNKSLAMSPGPKNGKSHISPGISSMDDQIAATCISSSDMLNKRLSNWLSPMRKVRKTQSAEVETGTIVVLGTSDKLATATPSNERLSNRDNEVWDKVGVPDLASGEINMRVSSGYPSSDCQSPPLRRSSRNRSQNQFSSPRTPRRNLRVTPTVHHENTGILTSPNIQKNMSKSCFTPKIPHEGKSMRLSLSAKRKQILQKLTDKHTDLTSPNKESTEIEKASQERGQSPTNITNLSNRKTRKLRLSLTARKRLMKSNSEKISVAVEEALDEADPHRLPEDTTRETTLQETTPQETLNPTDVTDTGRGLRGVAQRHNSSTRTTPKACRKETKESQGGVVDTVTSEHHQEKRKDSKGEPLKKPPSNKKRKSNAIHDGGSKGSKRRLTSSDYQEHVQQKHAGRLPSKARQIQESKADECCNNQPQPCPSCVEETCQQPLRPTENRQNLESIFNSDPNLVQPSFLGFDSDDITETEERLQQLTGSSSTNNLYANKLQEAALNVCCIPSSELCLSTEEEGFSNDSSDMNDMQEVVVGMALRNLANFPSDGSDWEAKVGGFMSVRLEEAMQIKKREFILAQTRVQEKENMTGNQYRQVISIADKLVPVESTENVNRQSHKTAQNLLLGSKTETKKVESMSGTVLNHSPGLQRTGSGRLNQSLSRRTENVENQEIRIHSSSESPLKVISPNRRLASSPQTSPNPICSTPKQSNQLQNDGKFRITFSPDTPVEERKLILEHYVHDVSEVEIDFPKFSSPRQSKSVSPVKLRHASRTKSESKCIGSPYKWNNLQEPRRSLFARRRNSTPGKVYHLLLNPPGSPRKREASPSHHFPSSPLKNCSTNLNQSFSTATTTSHSQPAESHPQVTYIPTNERSKVSPTFCANTKPNFSSYILHPGNKKRHSDQHQKPSTRSSTGAQRRSARTWSLCVSFDDDICRSEDVYEFIDDVQEQETGNSSQQTSPQQETTNSNTKKKKTSNRQNLPKDKVKQSFDQTIVQTESGFAIKTEMEQTESSSENDVWDEFGLPSSFFM